MKDIFFFQRNKFFFDIKNLNVETHSTFCMSPLKEKNDEDAEIAEKYVKTKDKCIVNFYPNNQKKIVKKKKD